MRDEGEALQFGRWLARLESADPDHERFTGAPLSIAGLSRLDVARLWAPAYVAGTNAAASEPARLASVALRRQADAADLKPTFDRELGLQTLQAFNVGAWAWALQVFRNLDAEPTPEMRREFDRILGPRERWPKKSDDFDLLDACTLVCLAEAERQDDIGEHLRELHPASLHLRAEARVLLRIGVPLLLALANTQLGYYWPDAEASAGGDPASLLASDPAYLDFARATLATALQRLEDIHAGRIAYRADDAFDLADVPVIARAARVAARHDDERYREQVLRLLPLSSVAPTAAKTVPSQSLPVALAHSIEGVPTPEGVQALRAALTGVRHAGLKKKLARKLKLAERALARRPELAMRRVTASAPPGRQQEAALAATLQAGWCTHMCWPFEHWLERLAGSPSGVPFATGLVWVADDAGSGTQGFVMRASGVEPTFIDALARPVSLPAGCAIRLWHPVHAAAGESRAWQSYFVGERIRQPLRQVFREAYRVSADEADATECNAFAGHELSVHPLLGLASREGWRIGRGSGLARQFGATLATFQVGAELHPGLQGYCRSTTLVFSRGAAMPLLRLNAVDPIVFSEAARAVDLLVSVSAFAIEDGTSELPLTVADLGLHFAGQAAPPASAKIHPRVARRRRLDHLSTLPLAGMATMRRETLLVVLAPQIAAGRVVVDLRHVRVGDGAVHLATGRASRNGEPLEIKRPAGRGKLAAMPWLPYDEALLQRIVDAVGALLDDAAASS